MDDDDEFIDDHDHSEAFLEVCMYWAIGIACGLTGITWLVALIRIP